MHIPALDYYTAAIVVDSAVTLFVGWRLGKKADKAVNNAAQEIEPAIRQAVADIAQDFQVQTKKEIVHAIEKLTPAILGMLKNDRNSKDISGPKPIHRDESFTATKSSN